MSFAGKFAFAYLCIVAILALLYPAFIPYPADLISVSDKLQAPSLSHFFGTDQFGRDVFSRVLAGSRHAIIVSLFASVISCVLGCLIGGVGAYYSARMDLLASRLADLMFSLPDILLALVLMAILGTSTTNLIFALSIVYTPIFIRISRSGVLQVKTTAYIQAAKSIGMKNRNILLRHILPNSFSVVLVQFTLTLGFALLAESALSFIGFGVEPGTATWGMMLREAKDWLGQAWWISVFPGAALSLSILSLNILGSELRSEVG